MQPTEFDRITQAIYAGVVNDRGFDEAVQLLAEQYRCRSAVFFYADRLLPSPDVQAVTGPFSDATIRARYLEYADDDPAPGAMARLAIGEAAATDRLFGPDVQDHSRFIREFYRPLGLVEALGGPVSTGNECVGIVAVHRGSDRPPFADEEIAGFGRLLLHFCQALALRRTFFTVSKQRRALADALDPVSAGIMIFDRDGMIVHANAKARAVLARNDGLSLTRAGQLQLRDAAAAQRMRAATAVADATLGPILRVPRSGGPQPYVVRLDRRAQAVDGTMTLYLCDPDTIPDDVPAILRAAFGLSKQSAGLVATLVAGGDLANYATAVGISRNTAKYHLQAAFTATGTARQADLVSHAAGILRDLGA